MDSSPPGESTLRRVDGARHAARYDYNLEQSRAVLTMMSVLARFELRIAPQPQGWVRHENPYTPIVSHLLRARLRLDRRRLGAESWHRMEGLPGWAGRLALLAAETDRHLECGQDGNRVELPGGRREFRVLPTGGG